LDGIRSKHDQPSEVRQTAENDEGMRSKDVERRWKRKHHITTYQLILFCLIPVEKSMEVLISLLSLLYKLRIQQITVISTWSPYAAASDGPLKMRLDCRCSCCVSCTFVNVDGFTSPSPGSAVNQSDEIEGFTTESAVHLQSEAGEAHHKGERLKSLNELSGYSQQQVTSSPCSPRCVRAPLVLCSTCPCQHDTFCPGAEC
jgi:hypothetical protein